MVNNTLKMASITAFKSDGEITVRKLESHETQLVSRCIHDEYGDTYPNKIVYNAMQLALALRTYAIYSLVAETKDGEIAGHLAIIRSSELPGPWEMGIGVVMRKFHNARIMDTLSINILEYAKHLGVLGVFAEPVLNHTYTQKLTMNII